jgi:hypothetical protein
MDIIPGDDADRGVDAGSPTVARSVNPGTTISESNAK